MEPASVDAKIANDRFSICGPPFMFSAFLCVLNISTPIEAFCLTTWLRPRRAGKSAIIHAIPRSAGPPGQSNPTNLFDTPPPYPLNSGDSTGMRFKNDISIIGLGLLGGSPRARDQTSCRLGVHVRAFVPPALCQR